MGMCLSMGGVRAGTGEMIQTEQPNEGVPGTLMGTAISLPLGSS